MLITGESIIRSMVVFLSRGDVEFENQTGCPICMMLVTFVILCLTGGIYDYVNDDILEQVKGKHEKSAAAPKVGRTNRSVVSTS